MRKNKDLFSIFPADAGVNPVNDFVSIITLDIPRGCGGEPKWQEYKDLEEQYSPQVRG